MYPMIKYQIPKNNQKGLIVVYQSDVILCKQNKIKYISGGI